MSLEVGAIVEGKVTGITKFGAFVALPEGKSGLVHISEIANTFVSDVNDHLSVRQTVQVRVLAINDNGKINLSIKQAAAPAPAPARRVEERPRPNTRTPAPQADPPSADKAFEDRLKKFMQESDSRISDNRMYADHRERRRRK